MVAVKDKTDQGVNMAKTKTKTKGKVVTLHVSFFRTDEITVRLAPGKTVADLAHALEYDSTVYDRGKEIGYPETVGTIEEVWTHDEEVQDIERAD